MKNTFVLIGGGEISKEETKVLDLEIKKLTNKAHPKILFFPIAARDSQGYIEGFRHYFKKLGFEVDSCKISESTQDMILKKLESCDAVYFGGGDTEYAATTLKRINFKSILKKVNLNKSLVISGISAGAMVWCRDIVLMKDGEYVDSTRIISGLGLIDLLFVPHFSDDMREDLSRIKNIRLNKIIYAVPNKSALVLKNGTMKIIGHVDRL